MTSKRILISADHGLAVIYFLQSDVVPSLLEQGVEVVVLTDGALKDEIAARFGRPGLIVEDLRMNEAASYQNSFQRERQWWLQFFRRVGSSNRINTEAIDSYVDQVAVEESRKRTLLMPAARLLIAWMRRSKGMRQMLVGMQQWYTPGLYTGLLDKYRPDLVVASTHGWRLDRYLLRDAVKLGIPTAAVIVGWDNPSSYGLKGAPVDWITCWSEIQKQELVQGNDWDDSRVNISGIPSYDGYFRGDWLIPHDEYFRQHGLDPDRKLLGYAASFVSFAPNHRNVEAIARLVAEDKLSKPSQLLIRLHPNHFQGVHLYTQERERIQKLASELPHVHVVEPAAMGGSMGHYSGEDMPEKASMMAHSDVFLTVYSTMVVEAACHDRPIVSVCLDTPGGWSWPRKFSLPLSRIGGWPTHSRFRQAEAGQVVLYERDLKGVIDRYLQDPLADCEQRRSFIAREMTYVDGSAGKMTADFLLSILNRKQRT
jgi:hypothetical protein